MPEIRRISPADFAVYRGEVLRAAMRIPASVELRRDDLPGQLVPIDELDEWYTVRTYGTFLEHEFEIYQAEGDRLFIGVVGRGDGHWLAETWAKPEAHPDVNFQQMDQFTFQATVPKEMVTEIHEERTDLLTSWLEQQEGRDG